MINSSTSDNISLSVVIAIYNEEKLIEKQLNKTIDELKSFKIDFELILVDDGSTDKTLQYIKPFSNRHEQVKIIENSINLNQGTSILRGFKAARKKFVIYNGIDLIFDFKNLKPILNQLEAYDFIVFERKNRFSNIPFIRNCASLIYMFIVKFLYFTKINDFNFVQIYKKETLFEVLPKIISRGPAIVTLEIILRLIKSKKKYTTLKFVPVKREEGKGKTLTLHTILWSLYELARLRIKNLKF